VADPFEQASKKIGEAAKQVEQELQDFVRHFNDDVVPKVRNEGSNALRRAAEELRKLADRMDDSKREGGK
jgi:hypothetical protein